MESKGNHLVDCLIPTDCVVGLDLLRDLKTRQGAGVLFTNPYFYV